MEVLEILEKAEEQMNKSLEYCKSQLNKVRTGRASTTLVDSLVIDLYGVLTPISQAATISVPDARTIVIQPWDRNSLSEIDKVIKKADLGFNPQNDGNIIRIPVPPLTEERRLDFVKMSKKYAEEGKIAIRSARRDSMDALKKGEKNKDFSEDDKKSGETEIQELTDKFVKLIDDLQAVKEKELMEG